VTTPARPAFFLSDFGDAALAYGKVAGWWQRGLHEPRHPFRLVTVATLSEAGPAARTVVLRAVEAERRTVWFHTDRRSPKFAELQVDPRLCLLWYDPEVRVQVRVAARAVLHLGDEVAQVAWRNLAETSRRDYAALTGPGGVLDADDGSNPADAESNFVAVACQFSELDVLELLPDGHRRARLHWSGTWSLTRLAP
jgi:pyridoxamine 5'-phosphate oxidase